MLRSKRILGAVEKWDRGVFAKSRRPLENWPPMYHHDVIDLDALKHRRWSDYHFNCGRGDLALKALS